MAPHLMALDGTHLTLAAHRSPGAGWRARYWRGSIAMITGDSPSYRGPDLA